MKENDLREPQLSKKYLKNKRKENNLERWINKNPQRYSQGDREILFYYFLSIKQHFIYCIYSEVDGQPRDMKNYPIFYFYPLRRAKIVSFNFIFHTHYYFSSLYNFPIYEVSSYYILQLRRHPQLKWKEIYRSVGERKSELIQFILF